MCKNIFIAALRCLRNNSRDAVWEGFKLKNGRTCKGDKKEHEKEWVRFHFLLLISMLNLMREDNTVLHVGAILT